VQHAGPAREIHLGTQKVAEAPSDEDFEAAAVWRLRLPQKATLTADALLRVIYKGDVARFYLNGTLLTDNFYNGHPFHLGLQRYAPEIYQGELLLKILPLRKDAPLYLSEDAQPDFGDLDSLVKLSSVEIIERSSVSLTT
jgi:beta-galactosidase